MANGDPTGGRTKEQTFEQWRIQIEAEIAELKMRFNNLREMRHQLANIEKRYCERDSGQTVRDSRPRQERQKNPRRDD